jgi:CTP:molybdopterin cytidylyltransferase MocA
MYVLATVLVIIMIAGIGTRNKVNKLMNDFDQGDLKEMMKDTE